MERLTAKGAEQGRRPGSGRRLASAENENSTAETGGRQGTGISRT